MKQVKCVSSADLLAPIAVGTSHSDGHLTEVCNFLPLKAIQVSLDGRTSIFKVLGG